MFIPLASYVIPLDILFGDNLSFGVFNLKNSYLSFRHETLSALCNHSYDKLFRKTIMNTPEIFAMISGNFEMK